MNKMMEKQAKSVIPYLKRSWKMQNDVEDKKTNFIYKSDGIEDILYEHKVRNNFDLNYAMQRYYNYVTSIQIEKIFTNIQGCEREEDIKNKEVDFWYFGIPFDLKVTSFPKRFGKSRDEFVNEREYRNEMIRWFYKNQSKDGRNLNQNRIFFVCQNGDGKNSYDNQLLKSDFIRINNYVQCFAVFNQKLKDNNKQVFNQLEIDGKMVTSEVIIFK
jgi:hypothetical protein